MCKNLYSPMLHAALLSVLGIPHCLEWPLIFVYNLVNQVMCAYCDFNSSHLVAHSIRNAPVYMTVA